LVLEAESVQEVKVEDVKAGGRYQVKERNSRKPEIAERTVRLRWQGSETEVRYKETKRLWWAIKDATNYIGRVEIVDDEGKRVDVRRWDIRKTYTAQPERGSYKPEVIERFLQYSREPRREWPQRREPEKVTDPREEEAPRIIASMWRGTQYESKLAWPMSKSQISHTHPEWQAWEERNDTAQVWLHMEDDETQEEVTLGRMAEEIEKVVEERWGVSRCTRVLDDHFHFERVERRERKPERPPRITREEANAEQLQAIDDHVEWMGKRDTSKMEVQGNPWVWSPDDPPEPEQTKKPQVKRQRPRRLALKPEPEPEKPKQYVVLKNDAQLPPSLAATNTSDLLMAAELVIRRRLKRQQQRRRRTWRRFNWTAEEPLTKAEQWSCRNKNRRNTSAR
jgi:hypothetical protein